MTKADRARFVSWADRTLLWFVLLLSAGSLVWSLFVYYEQQQRRGMALEHAETLVVQLEEQINEVHQIIVEPDDDLIRVEVFEAILEIRERVEAINEEVVELRRELEQTDRE